MRLDFWLFFGLFLIAWIIAFGVLLASMPKFDDGSLSQIALYALIASWLLIVPIGIRRQHDVGIGFPIPIYVFAGSVCFLLLLAVDNFTLCCFYFEQSIKLFFISLFVFALSLIFNTAIWLRPSQPNSNQFGPNPHEVTP